MQQKKTWTDASFSPTEAELEILKKYKKRSEMGEIWRRLRKNKAAVLGLVMLFIIFMAAAFADVLYDYESEVVLPNYSSTLIAPAWSTRWALTSWDGMCWPVSSTVPGSPWKSRCSPRRSPSAWAVLLAHMQAISAAGSTAL